MKRAELAVELARGHTAGAPPSRSRSYTTTLGYHCAKSKRRPCRPWRRGTVEGRASQSISTVIESPGRSGRGSAKRTMVLSGAKRIDRLDRLAHDPHVAHVIEREVGVLAGR